jgi:hypothetical protein
VSFALPLATTSPLAFKATPPTEAVAFQHGQQPVGLPLCAIHDGSIYF